jgi:hydrogenase maturation factor HypF (carbamoyltransferase family)
MALVEEVKERGLKVISEVPVYITIRRMKWLKDRNKWVGPHNLTIRLQDIAHYQPYTISDEQRPHTNHHALVKIVCDGSHYNEDGSVAQGQVMYIAQMEIGRLDDLLQPIAL